MQRQATTSMLVSSIRPLLIPSCSAKTATRRMIHSSIRVRSHENPLGIPRRNPNPAPTLPRRGAGPPQKSRIKGVKQIVVVASGKGGVGKSTVAANLALSLLTTSPLPRAPRIGLLDLDIFGPSVPKLMGLENAGDPQLSDDNKLVPLQNHGVKTMSIGYLLPPNPENDSPVVWRGMMVMKAVQQLLFDVDWKSAVGQGKEDLDVLVVDMPPGTGDVQLSLGQLVSVDGAVIVSTPQDVALVDARKGVGMFNKVSIPMIGLLLNMSHFTCSSCSTPHELFGSSAKFEKAANDLKLDVLGKLPLVTSVSDGGDAGRPVMVQSSKEGEEVRSTMREVGRKVWEWLGSRTVPDLGVRG
ncbi:hypothetical protein CI109_104630 [Kwoniella shandongensis]|uniref:Uncharacterized protein n=1 Tax=Kwoniella shandongensis TaxID=1734106 RepID=A0A5M6BVA7_9TREE|nr:uncharacterized protein CI109_004796 [Kwoniella shandongensis]KAA5526796.1 hypothetical protein CI109_004796 [Kwoniella shandongensis]